MTWTPHDSAKPAPITEEEARLSRIAIEHRGDREAWNDDEVGRVLAMLGLADDIDLA
jgi:hypothetical protein